VNLVLYAGILAPNAKFRARAVGYGRSEHRCTRASRAANPRRARVVGSVDARDVRA
jgi:hypothetical protein